MDRDGPPGPYILLCRVVYSTIWSNHTTNLPFIFKKVIFFPGAILSRFSSSACYIQFTDQWVTVTGTILKPRQLILTMIKPKNLNSGESGPQIIRWDSCPPFYQWFIGDESWIKSFDSNVNFVFKMILWLTNHPKRWSYFILIASINSDPIVNWDFSNGFGSGLTYHTSLNINHFKSLGLESNLT